MQPNLPQKFITPEEGKPDHFPSHDWFCHRCTKKKIKTPNTGLTSMSITSAREAIKRYNTNVATAQQEEIKKRIQNLKNLQATCPTTEIIEIFQQ